MKTLQEQIAENIEHIFDNTKRIHGNSEALDWIKIAIHRSAEFIYHKYLKAQAEQESNNRQQSEGSANNLKTAEEILYERGLITRSINDEDDMKVHCDFEHIVEAMQEYAAQFKAGQEKVTDEDIEKYADNACCVADEDEPEHTRIEIMLWAGFVQGAKDMRDGLITHNK